ncbi:MAG: HAMP domain-containing sensor histidine kinase [Planctomycetota bacterium]|nr:HAMP domain-containing sensor histidine kinase [Planctomycetota bacterium]
MNDASSPNPNVRRLTPKRSLLSKVVVLVTAAYFGIEVITLVPFAYLYRDALLEDRAQLLKQCAQKGRIAFDETSRGGIAPISSDLPAGPIVSFHSPDVTAYVFTGQSPTGVLGFNSNRELTPLVNESSEFDRAKAQVKQFIDTKQPSFTDRLGASQVHIECLYGKEDKKLQAVMYFSIPLNDIESHVLRFSAFSLAGGLLALLFFGAISILYLKKSFLTPLNTIIDADNAGRKGDFNKALIVEGLIPDDELGMIMHSRNRLQVQQQAYRESLDAKNLELSRQREALRRWGRELEKLVQRKSDELMTARESLFENEKFAALGRLAANVAHEINNPLASIAGYAEELRELVAEIEVVKEHPDCAHFPEALRIIEEQAFRCKDILKRLLGLARSERMNAEDVDVGKLVRETVNLTEASARRRNVELVARIPSNEGPFIETDSSSLVQVVTNLIENAIDAANAARESRDGQGRVEVSVLTRTAPNQDSRDTIVRVMDNGYGVPEDQREKIFNEFYTTKPIGRGTGLGLAICQTMTQRLGGHIEVESLDGSGAAFSIVLPAAITKDARYTDTPLPTRPPVAGDTASFQIKKTGSLNADEIGDE